MADVQDMDKERAFIQAGLNLSAETQSHAFCLPVPGTTPQLFVYLGEIDPFAMERELRELRQKLHEASFGYRVTTSGPAEITRSQETGRVLAVRQEKTLRIVKRDQTYLKPEKNDG